MGIREKILGWADRQIRLPAVGLDISDRSIKYARFERVSGGIATGKMALASFGEERIPTGVIDGGSITAEDTLISILRDLALRERRAFRSAGVVACLPEEKSYVRVFSLPRITDQEIAHAIRWKIEDQIPLPSRDIAYDYAPIAERSGAPDHRDVMVVAFPKEIVSSYARVIKAAGLTPQALELESQTLARAIGPEKPVREARMIVDMGRTRTSIVILAEDTLVFTATFPVGGIALEEAVARTLGVSETEAVKIKKESGLSRQAYEGKAYAALAIPLSSLAREIGRAASYYRDHAHAHNQAPAIAEITLSGGDANLLGLDTFLAAMTRIPVARADPFTHIRRSLLDAVPPMIKNQALGFTVAIGLALRGYRF